MKKKTPEHLQKGKKPLFFPTVCYFFSVFFISFQTLFLNETPAKNPKPVTSRIILEKNESACYYYMKKYLIMNEYQDTIKVKYELNCTTDGIFLTLIDER